LLAKRAARATISCPLAGQLPNFRAWLRGFDLVAAAQNGAQNRVPRRPPAAGVA
jgi:hypothetical protein